MLKFHGTMFWPVNLDGLTLGKHSLPQKVTKPNIIWKFLSSFFLFHLFVCLIVYFRTMQVVSCVDTYHTRTFLN